MNDMPPKSPIIELVRENRRSNQVILRHELWNELTFQAEETGVPFDKLVKRALKSYVVDLKVQQEKERMHADLSEYQLFPNYPVSIQPHPPWYYNLTEDKGEDESKSHSQEVKETKSQTQVGCTPCGFSTSNKEKRKSSKEKHHDKDKK